MLQMLQVLLADKRMGGTNLGKITIDDSCTTASCINNGERRSAETVVTE